MLNAGDSHFGGESTDLFYTARTTFATSCRDLVHAAGRQRVTPRERDSRLTAGSLQASATARLRASARNSDRTSSAIFSTGGVTRCTPKERRSRGSSTGLFGVDWRRTDLRAWGRRSGLSIRRRPWSTRSKDEVNARKVPQRSRAQ